MELGPLGTSELMLIAGGILLIILLVVILVALRGREDDGETADTDERPSPNGDRAPRRSPSITQASRDELIERAIRAETERDIFRATVKRLRAENERLRGGQPREDVRDRSGVTNDTSGDEDETERQRPQL